MSGNEDVVNIRTTADVHAAQAALNSIAASLERMGQKGEQSGEKMASGFQKLVGSFANVQAGISMAQGVLDSWIEANKRGRDEAEKHALANDKLRRSFQSQAGGQFSGGDLEKITAAGIKTAIPGGLDAAEKVAKAMVSGGFSKEDVLSGGLEQMLNIGTATGAQDLERLTAGVSLFLASSGQEKTTANVAKLGGQIHAAFADTAMEGGDIEDLAQQGSTLTEAGLSPVEQLAAFSTVRDVMNAPSAAVGLRNTVQNLAAAGATPEKTKALKSLGIGLEEVDFIGEDITQVLKRLKQGRDSVSKEKSQVAMAEIFGKEGISAANALLAGVDKIPERVKKFGDDSSFKAAIDVSQRGPAAENRRLDIEEQQALARPEVAATRIAGRALNASAGAAGKTDWARSVEQKSFEWLTFMGVGDEHAARFGTNMGRMLRLGGPLALPFGAGADEDRVQQAVGRGNQVRADDDALAKAIKENTEEVRKNNQLLQNRPIQEPPGVRPAALPAQGAGR